MVRIIGMIFSMAVLFGVDLTKYGLTPDSLAQAITTLFLAGTLVVHAVGYVIRYTKGGVSLGGRRLN